ncbi:hypothetical protein XENTR_v10021210 [Xenopus tropicalis]|uniref:Uncharacterized protein LOC100486535 isoform X1 n=1 Tax=Xenopus tropicalis TaxID=8364 RepID=A0A8J0R413_XENTR|nr:uncharacterized protein LOC100486535 isoform X1 [Xenopus tropicalis]XP_004917076.2 uncharacterized protein LOC100486535 isoform X1 [Xenopus tropicalis]KAE8585074.1 hypothetical protein XENTR_v10021210 [Xenopus tropicalis]
MSLGNVEMSHIKVKMDNGYLGKSVEIPKKRGRGRPLGSTKKTKVVSANGILRHRRGIKRLAEVAAHIKLIKNKSSKSRGQGFTEGKDNSASSSIYVGRSQVKAVSSQMPSVPKRARGRPRKTKLPLITKKVTNIEVEPGIENKDNSALSTILSECSLPKRGRLQNTELMNKKVKLVNGVEPGTEQKKGRGRPRKIKQTRKPKPIQATVQESQDIRPASISPQDNCSVEVEKVKASSTQNSQYASCESHNSSWPSKIINTSDDTAVTHWVVEEPPESSPSQPLYPTEERLMEQNEFRDNIIQGLADLKYQLTRELAAARTEMREGAEMVRAAIAGVSAEIHTLGLILQPLVTMISSRNEICASPALSSYRPQRDTPSENSLEFPKQEIQTSCTMINCHNEPSCHLQMNMPTSTSLQPQQDTHRDLSTGQF